MLYILATAQPKTIGGAFAILICAIAAAIPTALLYLKRYMEHRDQRSTHLESQRLTAASQVEMAKIKSEVDMHKADTSIESSRIATEQQKVAAEQKVELERIKSEVTIHKVDTSLETDKMKLEAKERAADRKAEEKRVKEILKDPRKPNAAKSILKGAQSVLTIAPKSGSPLESLRDENIPVGIDIELFRRKAIALGASTESSISEMAEMVIKYAPEASLAQYPATIPLEERAAMILGCYNGGSSKQQKQQLENEQKAFEQKLELEKKQAEHEMEMDKAALKAETSIRKKEINADVSKTAIESTASVVSDVGTVAVEGYMEQHGKAIDTVSAAVQKLPDGKKRLSLAKGGN